MFLTRKKSEENNTRSPPFLSLLPALMWGCLGDFLIYRGTAMLWKRQGGWEGTWALRQAAGAAGRWWALSTPSPPTEIHPSDERGCIRRGWVLFQMKIGCRDTAAWWSQTGSGFGETKLTEIVEGQLANVNMDNGLENSIGWMLNVLISITILWLHKRLPLFLEITHWSI